MPWRSVGELLGGALSFEGRLKGAALHPRAATILTNWTEWSRAESVMRMSRASSSENSMMMSWPLSLPTVHRAPERGDPVLGDLSDDDIVDANDDGIDTLADDAAAEKAVELKVDTCKALALATDCALIGRGGAG